MDVIADFAGYPQWAMAVEDAEVIIPWMDDRAERVQFSFALKKLGCRVELLA
jgi:hypothetical protein